jgi:hypothetical protein
MSRVKQLILLGMVLAIMEGTFFYFAFTENGYTELTVQALNDASYSLGSNKWIFFYLGGNGTSHEESTLNFPFPFWSIQPGLTNILLVYATTNQTGVDRMEMPSTRGDMDIVNGLEIIVHESSPDFVVLWLKPTH